MVCIILWKIWNAINLWVFKNEAPAPDLVARSAMGYMLDFNKSNPCLTVRKKPAKTSDVLNCPKVFHTIHVNDECFPNDYVVWRYVIKDNEKRVALSASNKIESSTGLSAAEALAIRWEIQVVVKLKLKRILVHSDAFILVDRVNMIKTYAILEPITLDCTMLLKNFAEASVLFVGRKLNAEAHHLIEIDNVICYKTWLRFIPTFNYAPNLCSIVIF